MVRLGGRVCFYRSLILISCLIALVSAIAYSLGNLKELGKLEKSCLYAAEKEDIPAIKREFSTINNTLKVLPESKRAAALSRLAAATKWGTVERASAYYVCAWYGVNYRQCRNYLLHSAFWWESSRAKDNQTRPFCWQENGFDLLYKLYEHNNDLWILHDLMIYTSDGAGATVLYSIKVDAIQKHTSDVLRTARLSKRGEESVVQMVAGKGRMGDVFHYDFEGGNRPLQIYVRRTASNPKNPMHSLAKHILEKARTLKVKGA